MLRDFVSEVLSGEDREGGREGNSEGSREGLVQVSNKFKRISTVQSVRDRHKTESSLMSTIAQLRATQVLYFCYVCMHIFHAHILHILRIISSRFCSLGFSPPSLHPHLHEQHDLKKPMSRADLLGRSLPH